MHPFTGLSDGAADRKGCGRSRMFRKMHART
jgi:hypothetical protein